MRQPVSMDMCIWGTLRSGTTMLADLFTVKGTSLVMSEADFHVDWHGRTVQRMHKLSHEVGLDVADEAPKPGEIKRTYVDWFAKNVLPQLTELDMWGVKQVDFH